MRDKKYYIAIDDFERQVVVNCLNEMIIVEQGKVVEVCAEPGEFTYDTSTEPSIFSGNLGDSLMQTFQTIGKRFTCGGEIIGDENTAATACPYCGNPVVMMAQFTGSLKPDCVIPFKLDKDAAIAALKKHFEGKHLMPKVFKDENHLQEIQGIYVPVWLFDAEAEADVRYKATQVRTWSDSRYNYTQTSLFCPFPERPAGVFLHSRRRFYKNG